MLVTLLTPFNDSPTLPQTHLVFKVLGSLLTDVDSLNEAVNLARTIRAAIDQYAIIQNPVLGNSIYAYEVDGAGGTLFMDDANIPSLLSLPYLGYLPKTDSVYLRTRKFLLSDMNHFFFSGTAGSGIGGPHEGEFYVWPMSIIMRALTSDDDQEILNCLATLKSTHAGTYFMHESFFVNNSNLFTRPWFAWANSLFGQLLLTLAEERPYLIF
eukprot:TRINITY_DN9994_c0_g1_i1.p2 TRINITY_DN9994_c0_g1~~TRINITY_DN9994_c0_g1_i1.p2  ORF type:complete len:212 (-),score=30.52 TRINITY_DN9994_c0_g1_i1:132-767(-)